MANTTNSTKLGRPKLHVLTEKQKARVIVLRAQGVTRRRIALDLEINYQALCSWIRGEK